MPVPVSGPLKLEIVMRVTTRLFLVLACSPMVVLGTASNAQAACSGSVYAPPGGGSSAEKTLSCGVFGHPGYRKGYSWNVATGSNLRVCAQVKGYDANMRATWYYAGCGTSGRVAVPWGNVGASGAFRASSTVLTGGFVSFRG